MRAITSKQIFSLIFSPYSSLIYLVFLNALLRLKDGMMVKALIEFLELEKAKVLFVRPDLFKSSASQDPTDRVDILSSRNSETQGKQ